MTKFLLEIDMENDAFSDPHELIMCVMRSASDLVGREPSSSYGWIGQRGIVRDTNGNTVGDWRVLFDPSQEDAFA